MSGRKVGVVCAAEGCNNKSYNCNHSFFRFPKDANRSLIWAINANRNDFLEKLDTLYKSQRLCQEHFEKRMFTNHRCERLSANAFPTLFPSFEASSKRLRGDHSYAKPMLLPAKIPVLENNILIPAIIEASPDRPIIMPSIEQCDVAAGNLAALPATLEMFDKFKQTSDNGKDSDSEESFHLQLDDDFIESSSVVSNGNEKEQKCEETEDDILNKFDTTIQDTADHLDVCDEDIILNDIDDDHIGTSKDAEQIVEKNPSHSPTLLSNTEVKITYSFEDYEDSGDGEFKSVYEIDAQPAKVEAETQGDPTELMEVAEVLVTDPTDQTVTGLKQQNLKDASMDVETNKTSTNAIKTIECEDSEMAICVPINEDLECDADINMTEPTNFACGGNSVIPETDLKEILDEGSRTIDDDVEMSEAPPTEKHDNEQIKLDVTSNSREHSALESNKTAVGPISDSPLHQQQNEDEGPISLSDSPNAIDKDSTLQQKIDKPEEANNSEEQAKNSIEVNADTDSNSDEKDICNRAKAETNTKSNEKQVFKIPDELSKESDANSADLSNEKSNDKTEDDEADLLDVSMIRETEEDDAFAIADAIEDTEKETQASEKSDEEQSERMETEQEISDGDKDTFDNDNAMGFDDGEDEDDDESSTREVNVPSTSSSGDPKNKIKETSDISEDSASDHNSKLVTVDKASDLSQIDEESISNDGLSLVIDNDVGGAIQSCDNKTNDNNGETKEIKKFTDTREAEPSEKAATGNTETRTDKLKSSLNKRSLSLEDLSHADDSTKKPRLSEEIEQPSKIPDLSINSNASEETPALGEQVKTLTSFAKFMQCRKLSSKLSRSDLEQFCIQKICECLMLKSSEGELHQTIKKHEKAIDNLRKDLQQLNKQCKDLEIVNKKLMSELKNQNPLKKPVMPLRITRSVGLQVRLNPGNEVANQNRRRTVMLTPQKSVLTSNVVNNKTKGSPLNTPPSVARQVLQSSPQKSPLNTGQPTTSVGAPMLSQALQKRPVVAKRTTPIRKQQSDKTGNPGVIDLTDEDDKLAQNRSSSLNNAMKIINNIASPAGNKNVSTNKQTPAKSTGKQVVSKTVPMGTNKGNNISQGIRLTPTSQMVYVVPTTINSNGQQKVFVNFQPTNGVLSGSLNGSTMSVMSGKQSQTLTLKSMPSPIRHKHPAPLPATPRMNLDPKLKAPLPRPHLTIKKIDTGIILQWKMPYNLDLYENIASYQLYAYQETNSPPSTDMWRKVGDVKALALPMACTLTQFADKNKYFFAVRSVDVHKRIGAFSEPEEISL